MIKLEHVTKNYNNDLILNDLNINFWEGNIYCLKGISGSGKTTLLNIISGIDKEYSGTYLLDGKDVKKFSKKEDNYFRQSVGYMMQKSFLYKKLTIKENLLLVKDNAEQIEKLAKEFGALNILDKRPSEVSGGELQRVALIRALLGNNRLIILDEPTSNLDYNNSIEFAKFLKSINIEDKIIIIATHKDIFDKIANKIININFGNINVIKDKERNKVEGRQLRYKNNKKRIITNAIKLHHKQGIIAQLSIILLVGLLFLTISIYFNYKKVYMEKLLQDVPYNLIDISKGTLGYEEIISNYQVSNKYLDYQFNYEGINCYYYFPLKLSIIKQDNLSYGVYPSNDNEVLISEAMARSTYVNMNLQEIIGNSIIINNEEFIISGIIGDELNDKMIIEMNIIYNNIYKDSLDKVILFSYDKIKEIGSIKDNDKEFIQIDSLDMYKDSEFNDTIFVSSNLFNTYKNDMNDVLVDIWSKIVVVFIILVNVFVVFIMFLINELSIELFYRKKEIGYLQMFHYTKDDISIFIISDYMVNFMIDGVIGFILYIGILKGINKIYGYQLLLGYGDIILIWLCLVLIFILIIDIPLRKYLKKDIKKLIF